MKIVSVKICLPVILILLVGCGKSEKKITNDTTADVNTEAAVVDAQNDISPLDASKASEGETEATRVEETQMAMLNELLSIKGGEDEDMLRKCCTKNALKQLNEDYEYDDYDENSIAIWAINGLDIPDVVPVLASLTKVGPNTYRAEFKADAEAENGATSIMEYKLAEENGQWKIDSYKYISPN